MKAFLLVVIGALGILWISEKCKGPPGAIVAPDTALVSENARLLAQIRADSIAKAVSDSIEDALRRLAQSQADRATRAERAARSHGARADSALSALDDALTAADSIPPLVAAVGHLQARGDSLVSALSSEREAHATTKSLVVSVGLDRERVIVQRDSARALAFRWETEAERLAKIANDRRPRWPSKTESFLFGVVAGAAIIAFTGK